MWVRKDGVRMVTIRDAIIGAALLMAGCATERWVQEGKTDEDVAAALVVCEQSMPPQPLPPTDPMYTMPDQSAVMHCMKDKGYMLVREK